LFALEMAMAPRVALEVSPALVAFSEMLSLPCAAMQTVVEHELDANTALERLDGGECPICRDMWRTRCPVCAPPARGPTVATFLDAGERATSEPDTHALLREVRMETAAADQPIAEYVIDSLDAHGLLDRSCAELADELGVAEAAVERVLDAVRRCGPPGVGARDVAECLLAQLDALELDGPRERLARAVIADHLPALARGRFASIARALGASRADVEQVLELIRCRLRPYPAFDGSAPAESTYVVPDVVVREDGGVFSVDLVEPALNRLRVRHDMHGADASRARSFLGVLRDRWDTLRRVAEYAVEHQQAFLASGPAALRPLTRVEVAAALGLHESTVSRAVTDKHVLLPDRTIVPLARFFGVSGGLDAELRRLLEAADGPISDQRLADRLCAAGYPIARRTVAKHRARLGSTASRLH
jgi:RNA polymerase sigma-54 factor